MDDDQLKHLKGAIEALLFVSDKPVELKQLREAITGSTNSDLKKAIEVLQDEHDERNGGVAIIEVAEGYQMLSNATYAEYIRNFFKTRSKEKLSRPALEVLAIVAYKQPVTRSDVELIRGVNSDGVMTHLLDKGLIKLAGRKEVPGRPYLHETTSKFLEYFGLKSLEDMPSIEDFPSLQEAASGEEEEESSGLFDKPDAPDLHEAIKSVQEDDLKKAAQNPDDGTSRIDEHLKQELEAREEVIQSQGDNPSTEEKADGSE